MKFFMYIHLITFYLRHIIRYVDCSLKISVMRNSGGGLNFISCNNSIWRQSISTLEIAYLYNRNFLSCKLFSRVQVVNCHVYPLRMFYPTITVRYPSFRFWTYDNYFNIFVSQSVLCNLFNTLLSYGSYNAHSSMS